MLFKIILGARKSGLKGKKKHCDVREKDGKLFSAEDNPAKTKTQRIPTQRGKQKLLEILKKKLNKFSDYKINIIKFNAVYTLTINSLTKKSRKSLSV